MATTTTVPKGSIGAYEIAMTANAVDTVTFDATVGEVRVESDGAAAIYFTVDGTNPAVKGAGCYYVPAIAGAVTTAPLSGGPVKLVSSGTPTYSVTGSGQR